MNICLVVQPLLFYLLAFLIYFFSFLGNKQFQTSPALALVGAPMSAWLSTSWEPVPTNLTVQCLSSYMHSTTSGSPSLVSTSLSLSLSLSLYIYIYIYMLAHQPHMVKPHLAVQVILLQILLHQAPSLHWPS